MLQTNKPIKFQVRASRGVYYPEIYGGILLTSVNSDGYQEFMVYWSDNGTVNDTKYSGDIAEAYFKDGTWKKVD